MAHILGSLPPRWVHPPTWVPATLDHIRSSWLCPVPHCVDICRVSQSLSFSVSLPKINSNKGMTPTPFLPESLPWLFSQELDSVSCAAFLSVLSALTPGSPAHLASG